MSIFGSLLKGVLGAGEGFLAGGPVGAAVGGLGALTSSNKPQKRTDQAAGTANANQQQLQQIGQLLQQRYQNAAPQERSILDYFYQRAGLGPGGNAPGGNLGGGTIPGSVFGGAPGAGTPGYGAPVTHAPMGTAPGLNGGHAFAGYGSRKTLPGFQQTQAAGAPVSPITGPGGPVTPGLVNSNLGIWNSPQYQLLRQQAEESANRQSVDASHLYNNSLIARGLQNSSLAAGGQAAIAGAAHQGYSDFVRQLALSAADKQDQLVGQALGGLQGSLAAGPQAGSLFGAGAGLGQTGQQINQAQNNLQNSLLGQATQAAAQFWGLGQYGKQAAGGGGGGSADFGFGPVQGSSTTADQAYDAAYGIPHEAHGGYVQAGQPVIVGDGRGPEVFVPRQDGMIMPNPADAAAPGVGSPLQQAILMHLLAQKVTG